MAEQLGSLARTHTCGALRPAHVGEERRAARLGASRPRSRIAGVPRRPRSPRPDAGDRRRRRRRCSSASSACGRSSSSRCSARSSGARRRPSTCRCRPARSRCARRKCGSSTRRRRRRFRSPRIRTSRKRRGLKYRYLDLRRPQLQHNIGLRHRITMALRKYFDEQGFYEIETPILTKSTPEGARDFLVPARVHPGEFYALPQSPQIFKQILMIAGFDRYVQIARCFRDEALRADRQLEFTQVDLEMSFATPPLVFEIVEGALAACFREIGVEIPRPFRRMPYADAIAKYGSDKPDLRFGMEIQDFGRCSRSRRSAFSAKRSSTAAPFAASSFRARRNIRAARSTSWSSRPSRPALRASSTRATPPKACRCRRSRSAKKARVRCWRRPARRRKTCSCWRRARPMRRRRCLDNCGCRSRRRRT